jgi:hypothetical protein
MGTDESGGRVTMRLAEVERLEGVGGIRMVLRRLWKCVKNQNTNR